MELYFLPDFIYFSRLQIKLISYTKFIENSARKKIKTVNIIDLSIIFSFEQKFEYIWKKMSIVSEVKKNRRNRTKKKC